MTSSVEESFSLHIAPADVPGWRTLVLSGDLDASSAPALDAAVDDAQASGITRLVVDAGALQFLDSSGLRSLVRARERLGGRPEVLVLRNPPANCRRVLEITGLNAHFAVEYTGELATSAKRSTDAQSFERPAVDPSDERSEGS